jgi:hypothetical protein
MDVSQSFGVENELNDGIVDHQKEAQVELPNGSPNKSNTPSRHNKQIVEVPTIGMKFDCDDSAYEYYQGYAQRIFICSTLLGQDRIDGHCSLELYGLNQVSIFLIIFAIF